VYTLLLELSTLTVTYPLSNDLNNFMVQWIMTYFGGPQIDTNKVFLQQKRIITIMTGSSSRTSYKPLFQGLELWNLASQYILSFMRFLSQNLELYIFNSTISGFNTINKLQSRTPTTTLTVYWRGGYYKSIKIFKTLPNYIVQLVLRQMFHIKFEVVFNWQSLLLNWRMYKLLIFHLIWGLIFFYLFLIINYNSC